VFVPFDLFAFQAKFFPDQLVG